LLSRDIPASNDVDASTSPQKESPHVPALNVDICGDSVVRHQLRTGPWSLLRPYTSEHNRDTNYFMLLPCMRDELCVVPVSGDFVAFYRVVLVSRRCNLVVRLIRNLQIVTKNQFVEKLHAQFTASIVFRSWGKVADEYYDRIKTFGRKSGVWQIFKSRQAGPAFLLSVFATSPHQAGY
jgi:hypothetical protein